MYFVKEPCYLKSIRGESNFNTKNFLASSKDESDTNAKTNQPKDIQTNDTTDTKDL